MYTEKTYGYIDGLFPPDGLEELRAYAEERKIPIMRRTAAQILKTMVAVKQPQRLLEFGTAIGYSGCVMLSSCNGRLTTVESDEQSYFVAAENFKMAGFADRVTQALGDANEEIEKLSGTFDFVFLDYAKAQYVRLLPHILRRLEPGGVLVADNVLFRGYISGEERRKRRFVTIVKRMREFLETLATDPSVTTSVLPVCDGMSVSVKEG